MAKTNLTAERLREILDYNPSTGVFTWKRPTSFRVSIGMAAGYTETKRGASYIQIRLYGVLYPAHRLAWFYVTGVWPKHQIDHINGVGSDNYFSNLREATDQQNKQNMAVSKRSKSGLRGVHFVTKKNKWCAQITFNRNTKSLGYFPTKELAYSAYLDARKVIHTFCPEVRSN